MGVKESIVGSSKKKNRYIVPYFREQANTSAQFFSLNLSSVFPGKDYFVWSMPGN